MKPYELTTDLLQTCMQKEHTLGKHLHKQLATCGEEGLSW